MTTSAGTYKANRDFVLLLWKHSFANQFAANYVASVKRETLPHSIEYPDRYQIKKDQELTIEYGVKTCLLKDIGDLKMDINSVDVTVKVGNKIYSGVCLTYNDYDPTIVDRDSYLRIVKKRTKLAVQVVHTKFSDYN